MDEKIITKFEVNVLVREESMDEIKRVFKAHNVEVEVERPIQRMRLSYDIKGQQYAFFASFDILATKDEEKTLRADLLKLPSINRVLITERREKRQDEKKSSGDAPKKSSRLKSALQAMLPNEALEKKIEEILQ